MKKQAIAVFLTLLLTIPLMNGCGKQSEQPDSAMESTGAETYEASSDVVDYEQDDDDFVYDGTFNEEVFEHICNDIKIDGTPLSMPGVFNEWDKGFSARFLTVDEVNNLATYELLFGDSSVGFVVFDSSQELTLSRLMDTVFYNLCLSPSNDSREIIVADIRIGDSAKDITEVLGTADKSEYSEGKGYYEYTVNDDRYVRFSIKNDAIDKIVIKVYD